MRGTGAEGDKHVVSALTSFPSKSCDLGLLA